MPSATDKMANEESSSRFKLRIQDSKCMKITKKNITFAHHHKVHARRAVVLPVKLQQSLPDVHPGRHWRVTQSLQIPGSVLGEGVLRVAGGTEHLRTPPEVAQEVVFIFIVDSFHLSVVGMVDILRREPVEFGARVDADTCLLPKL